MTEPETPTTDHAVGEPLAGEPSAGEPSAGEPSAGEPSAMPTSRLETFSDGVFAIAATLLILDVHAAGSGRLGTTLLHSWPSYAAYAVSFVTIGIIWINHHTVFAQIERVNHVFLIVNVVFLMLVAFIPFPTALVASHLRGGGLQAAALVYGANLTSTAVCFNGLWFYASRHGRLLRADANRRVVSGISRSYLPGPVIYLVATLVALASPQAAVAMFAAITLFYVLESSLFGRSGS
ncbi:MAG TPA: TMEM175 family protein [Acidimicrobiales bacterium]|nr:TMEM175 family protein [Acidimicrobiales bacterium]